MLLVVSPAKNLDFESPLPSFINSSDLLTTGQAVLIEQTQTLSKHCQKLSPADLSSLMKISDKLAILNAERFASLQFPFTNDNARPSMFAFNGDVYAGLDAQSLNAESVAFAQKHLRILSGLYGVLKPLDLMQAYRLEMGTKLKVGEANNLYQYWQNLITLALNESIKEQNDNVLVNLASKEYFSAVQNKELKAKVYTPHFKDEKNGQFKIISFYAKKARGLMARFVLENKITDIAGLKAFDTAGYYFDETDSTETDLVFKRKQQA